MTTSPPMMTEAPVLSREELAASLELFEFAPGKKVSIRTLRTLLPDIETTLFFAKVYALDYIQLSDLIRKLFNTSVIAALLKEGGQHSHDLQSYVVDTVPESVLEGTAVSFDTDKEPAVDTEILGQLWESVGVQVADAISQVAVKLGGVLDHLPSKYGDMVFTQMNKLNVQRNSIGRFDPAITHRHDNRNLVIFDVSGSMSQTTVQTIVDEVVGLAYKANAALAIVSSNTYFWEAGTFDSASVLECAEYAMTHYETLVPVLNRTWDTVITVADYDSSYSAKNAIAGCSGRVGTLLDLSLVDCPTFLAECVGQLAAEVKPLLVGNSSYVL